MTSVNATPLACVASAIPADQRPGHFALIQRLFGSVLERHTVPGGYSFQFAADAFAEVTTFVANERKCCPFLHFVIEVPPASDRVTLTISGPEGTPKFLDAELLTPR